MEINPNKNEWGMKTYRILHVISIILLIIGLFVFMGVPMLLIPTFMATGNMGGIIAAGLCGMGITIAGRILKNP